MRGHGCDPWTPRTAPANRARDREPVAAGPTRSGRGHRRHGAAPARIRARELPEELRQRIRPQRPGCSPSVESCCAFDRHCHRRLDAARAGARRRRAAAPPRSCARTAPCRRQRRRRRRCRRELPDARRRHRGRGPCRSAEGRGTLHRVRAHRGGLQGAAGGCAAVAAAAREQAEVARGPVAPRRPGPPDRHGGGQHRGAAVGPHRRRHAPADRRGPLRLPPRRRQGRRRGPRRRQRPDPRRRSGAPRKA